MMDRIVIGGGFSGLVVAREAARMGESVTLIEKASTLGGMVGQTTVGEWVVDSGAEAFSVVGDAVVTLIEDLGLGDEIVYPTEQTPKIVTAHGSFSIPQGVMGIPADLDALLDIPGLSSEVIGRARERDRAPWDPDLAHATVAELVIARLGREVLEVLVEPLCLGVHSCSASDIEARAIFPDLMRVAQETESLVEAVAKVRGVGASPGSAVATLRGGLHRLVDALSAEIDRLGVRTVLGGVVDSVAWDGDLWTVETTTDTYRSAQLSVCTGAPEASRLLASLPPLVAELSDIRTVDQALSIAVVRAPDLNEFPLGSGALVAAGVGIEAKATTHLNAKWSWWRTKLPADVHVLRFSFGRGGALPKEPFGTLVDEAMRVLYQVPTADIIARKDVVWRGGVVRPTQGHTHRVSRLRSVLEDLPLSLHGAYMSGNGLLGISRSLTGGNNVRAH